VRAWRGLDVDNPESRTVVNKGQVNLTIVAVLTVVFVVWSPTA
jgi:hypothetical protein